MCRNIRCDGFFVFTGFIEWELNRCDAWTKRWQVRLAGEVWARSMPSAIVRRRTDCRRHQPVVVMILRQTGIHLPGFRECTKPAALDWKAAALWLRPKSCTPINLNLLRRGRPAGRRPRQADQGGWSGVRVVVKPPLNRTIRRRADLGSWHRLPRGGGRQRPRTTANAQEFVTEQSGFGVLEENRKMVLMRGRCPCKAREQWEKGPSKRNCIRDVSGENEPPPEDLPLLKQGTDPLEGTDKLMTDLGYI